MPKTASLPTKPNPYLVGMEYTTRWIAYTLRIPASFFSRADRPSHITDWRVSDGSSGHRTPAMSSLASMSPSLKSAALKPCTSSLISVRVQGSRPDDRFPCDLEFNFVDLDARTLGKHQRCFERLG